MPIFSLSGLISDKLFVGNESVKLDGLVKVSPTNSRIVTEHPVEQGYNISDAQHQLPIQMSFQAWVTDNPQSILDSRVFTNIANSTGLDLVEGNVKKQLAKIESELNRGGLITLKTKYALYEDFYCTSFTYDETSTSAIQLNFTILEKMDNSGDDRTTAFFESDIIGLWS